MEKLNKKLLNRCKDKLGRNLKALILVGSANFDDFYKKDISDIDYFIILNEINASDLSEIVEIREWFKELTNQEIDLKPFSLNEFEKVKKGFRTPFVNERNLEMINKEEYEVIYSSVNLTKDILFNRKTVRNSSIEVMKYCMYKLRKIFLEKKYNLRGESKKLKERVKLKVITSSFLEIVRAFCEIKKGRALRKKDVLEISGLLPKDIEKLLNKIREIRNSNPKGFDKNFLINCYKQAENLYNEAINFLFIRSSISNEKNSIVVLIGGTAGVGKTTVAKEICRELKLDHRFGTGYVREVLRSENPNNNLLDSHTFEAFKYTDSGNIISGFKEQAERVCKAVNRCISRSEKEGTSIVIEGNHLLPQFLKREKVDFFTFLTCPSEEKHLKRLNSETHSKRNINKADFKQIKKIEEFILSLGDRYNIEIVQNNDLHKTKKRIINSVENEVG